MGKEKLVSSGEIIGSKKFEAVQGHLHIVRMTVVQVLMPVNTTGNILFLLIK